MSTTGPHPLSPTEPMPRQANGWGLAALITGIVAVVLAVVPFLCFLAFPVAIAAVVLGIVGLRRRGRRRATSITGLALGGVALLLAIVMSVVTIGLVRSFTESWPSDFPPYPDGSPGASSSADGIIDDLGPGPHEVTLTVGSSSGVGEAGVSWSLAAGTAADSGDGPTALPFTLTRELNSAVTVDDVALTVTAVRPAGEPTSTLVCSISVDGEVVSVDYGSSTVRCTARTQ